MGYSVNGKCGADSAEGLSLFQQNFPVVDALGITHLTASSVSGNSITYSTFYRSLTSTTTRTTNNATVLMPACSEFDAVAFIGPLLQAALFSFFIAFFLRKAIRKMAHFAGGMQSDF